VKLLVYLRDGRTVYKIERRHVLAKLLSSDPHNENPSVAAVRGTWNPETGEYMWERVSLRHIAKNSVSVVEEDTLAYKGAAA